MLDIKEYLRQTKTVLITQDAFDELKQRAFTQPDIIYCKDCVHHIDGFFCRQANHHTNDNEHCASVFGAERRKE